MKRTPGRILPLAADDPARPILVEFKEMLEILLRKDLSEEERGLLIRERFPREKLEPLMERARAIQQKFTSDPSAKSKGGSPAKA